jgi:hypothetical protein
MIQIPVEFIVEQLDSLNRARKADKSRKNSQRKADMLLAMKEANVDELKLIGPHIIIN